MADDDKTPDDEETPAEPKAKAAAAKSPAPLPSKRTGKKKKKKGAAAAVEKSTDDNPDALIASAMRATQWANRHWKQLAGGAAVLVAAGGIYWGYVAYKAGREEKASTFAETGAFAELVDVHSWDDNPSMATFTSRRLTAYPDTDARQKAVLASYGSAHAQYPDTGPAILARLAEAGVHLDRGEWQEALDGYNEVKTSRLAPVDGELRLRCAEGVGYAFEGMGKIDEARKAYDELANINLKGAKALGMYHLARLDLAGNQKEPAIAKLKDAYQNVSAAAAGYSVKYLKERVEKLLGQLDPSAVPKKPMGLDMPDFDKLTPEQRLQLQQLMQQNGAGG